MKATNFDFRITREVANYMLIHDMHNYWGFDIMCKEYGQDDDWVSLSMDDLDDEMFLDPDWKTLEIWANNDALKPQILTLVNRVEEIIKSKQETFEIYSSEGSITCDKATGIVLERSYKLNEKSPHLASIIKADIKEFLTYWKLEELYSSIDILDIGTWHKDGSYTAAEEDWRNEIKTAKAEEEGSKFNISKT
jgi:hypothetical protein